MKNNEELVKNSDLPDNALAKTDEELVFFVLENRDFFLHIVNRYQIKLFNYVKRISNFRDEEIEDILQDIFVKVYRNLNSFDHELKFSSWIYRIAHNAVIDHFRKNKNYLDNVSIEMEDNAASSLADDFDIRKDIDNQLLRKKINKALDKLDYKYKEVLILKYLEEKDYQEISDIIKKPVGTVASRMNRAKKEFKEMLKFIDN